MKFDMEHGTAVLLRTPATLRSMLQGLPVEWLHATEGGESWSPFVIVGHLLHGEVTDWIPRAKIICEHGESQPFESFDRFAQLRDSEGKSLRELLDAFESQRATNLNALAAMNLQPQDYEKRGHHPELGTVTLGQLLSTWVAHDLGHIAQVSRVMAKQYRGEIGPWIEYLSIVTR